MKNLYSPAATAYLAALEHIEGQHPDISGLIAQELLDQRKYLKLIASENYSSLAVQLAMGNLLTDKYAEGVPYRRFYAGCDNVDAIESLAVDELKNLYGAEHAYVQPHSGADANIIAFWSLAACRVQDPELERLGVNKLDELEPSAFEELRKRMQSLKLLGMSLNSGGHLTHGYRHNLSAKMMQCFSYEVDPNTGLLDYEALSRQTEQIRPDILLAGYSAYSRCIDFEKMRTIADDVGAHLMVDMAHFSGLVAGKVLCGPFDPVPYADIVTSTTHKTLRGPRGGFVLCKEALAQTVDKGCPMVLGGPLPHVMAAKAIAFREANTHAFQSYSQQVVANARALARGLQENGVQVLTGGTDNHQVLVEVSKTFGLTGRQCESALRDAHLTVNRNAIPNDENGPWYTSGLRLGTPALTTLGMGEKEMKQIASVITDVLKATEALTVERTGQLSLAKYSTERQVLESAHARVAALLRDYPLYPEIPVDFAGKKASFAK